MLLYGGRFIAAQKVRVVERLSVLSLTLHLKNVHFTVATASFIGALNYLIITTRVLQSVDIFGFHSTNY